MSDALSLDFSLAFDPFGKLVVTLADGTQHVGAVVARAFPIATPDQCISILSAEGKELAWVAHLNDLLRSTAAANPATTVFVTGPPEYCTEPIASDLAYRWDGVHAFKPGAKLTFEAIAGQLLAIPVG